MGQDHYQQAFFQMMRDFMRNMDNEASHTWDPKHADVQDVEFEPAESKPAAVSTSDSQFKAFVRFLLDAVRDAGDESDPDKRTARLERIVHNLECILDD